MNYPLLPSRRELTAPRFVLAALPLLLVQHGLVAAVYWWHRVPLRLDAEFWLLPLRRLTGFADLRAPEAASVFFLSLVAAWLLAVLSFRRALRSRFGYGLAALTIVPGVQYAAVALLALWPVHGILGATAGPPDSDAEPGGFEAAHVLQGVLAGIAIIVAAVLVSALTFGAYGWGLFVLTPFTVGLTTAYLANRRVAIGGGRTVKLVFVASTLGCVALIMLALEGLACLVLASPLGAVAALAGCGVGLALAQAGHRRGKPLLTVAVLPAVFMLEAAMPPAASIASRDSITIAAPPAAVWHALTSDAPIAEPAGLVGRAGLAYALGGRIAEAGVGGERLGVFSTGMARERITEWTPGQRLSLALVEQPPAMEEMSPYRQVHAPHVNGYFETETMRFEIAGQADGRTRVTIHSTHVLRIDPIPYWEPLARWAIHRNSQRVLRDIRAKAEGLD